MKLVELSR